MRLLDSILGYLLGLTVGVMIAIFVGAYFGKVDIVTFFSGFVALILAVIAKALVSQRVKGLANKSLFE